MARAGWWTVCLAFIWLCGCTGPSSWMPMREGQEWSYLVRDSFGSKVMTVAVSGTVRVGLHRGWSLTGSGGESRMAWVAGELVQSEAAAMSFDPPVPVLRPSEQETEWIYLGRCSSRGSEEEAVEAVLSQKPDVLNVGGFERESLLVVMKLSFNGTPIEIRTWFAHGVGVLRQEQRNDGNLVVAMEIVEGG